MRTGIRPATISFAVLQLVGLVCMFTWQSAPLAIASLIWGTAVVTLFPGNFISTILIEKLFWTGLRQSNMLAAGIPLLIAVNGALWCGFTRAIRLFRRRLD
jgi:hypothetical protein